MEELAQGFEEHFEEIEAYLQLLENIEDASRSGPPAFANTGKKITTQQQKILYSGIFLQLYNLVESSVVKCIDGVTLASLGNADWAPGDLTEEIRHEWVRVMARTHTELNYENRLKSALDLCQHLVDTLPVNGFNLEKGGGGNWDDINIEKITKRLGFNLSIRPTTKRAVKRVFKDDLGALSLVKKQRNSLAHGNITFTECGGSFTVRELRGLADCIAAYMREVVQAFSDFIDGHLYLIPDKRPARVEV